MTYRFHAIPEYMCVCINLCTDSKICIEMQKKPRMPRQSWSGRTNLKHTTLPDISSYYKVPKIEIKRFWRIIKQ